MGKNRHTKDMLYWMDRTDVFYKSPASIRAAKEREAKRLYWKDKTFDADENDSK